MASSASSPVRSPAAAVNVSRTRWKHRSTSAMNSAFLVGNSRNRYGWLIPARRATSSVEVPASPRGGELGHRGLQHELAALRRGHPLLGLGHDA